MNTETIKSPSAPATGYAHPTTIEEFEAVYRQDYDYEIRSCDCWIRWCERMGDSYGKNFHQGLRSAHVFNNIKMEQLIRVLKQEPPNNQAHPTAAKTGVDGTKNL